MSRDKVVNFWVTLPLSSTFIFTNINIFKNNCYLYFYFYFTGYRETAFAYAITAAGVAHSVARACAQGKLLACSCDHGSYRADHFPYMNEPLQENYQNSQGTQATQQWKWGGCSHNIDFGTTFSKKFLDSREKAGDLHSNVNLHNNEIGRQVGLIQVYFFILNPKLYNF